MQEAKHQAQCNCVTDWDYREQHLSILAVKWREKQLQVADGGGNGRHE
jgi:hypothetical protein